MAATDMNIVRYGVPFKIRHVATGQSLHSHAHNYETGSHQQEVTCFVERDDNDWWIVKGPDGSGRWNCPIGTPVKNHSLIRLEHMLTERNLHSHNGFQSPATHQQEVTAFGEHGIGDGNDNWRVEVHGEGPNIPWIATHHFRLIHVNTNHALHSHHGHLTRHQQEVTCFGGRDNNDLWQVERNS